MMKRYKHDCCKLDGELREDDFEILDAAGFLGWRLVSLHVVDGETYALFQKEYEGEYDMGGLPDGFKEWADEGSKRPKELEGFNWSC